MAAATESVVEDLTDTCWRDDQWLQIFPLNTFTALDYFSFSPFFVRGCNNDIARMQGLDSSKMGILPPGIEYVVQDAQEPHLFVIRRQHRTSPKTSPTPQAIYYILDGTIYQAPSLHAALTARLNRCLYSLRRAFHQMQADLDPLIKGLSARDQEDTAEVGVEPKTEPTTSNALSAVPRKIQKEERQQMEMADRVILEVLRQFSTPNNVPLGQPAAPEEKDDAYQRELSNAALAGKSEAVMQPSNA
eukprot:jgi/Botrbrau1/468/Bobra.110_2s0107.1